MLIAGWLLFLAACEPQLGDAETLAGAPSADSDEAMFCDANDEGSCVVSTDVCNPQDIVRTDVNTTCSTCQADAGERLICGEITEAQCFDLESPSGASCQRCITVDGEMLYDDCSAEFAAVAQACEEVQRANEDALRFGMLACDTDADCAASQSCFFQSGTESGVCVGNSELMLCSVCRDEDGNVLEESCRPQADSCVESVDEQGRNCTECSLAGEVIWRECSTPDLEPDRCEVYGNEAGRCVDCYDGAGELLSHQCTVSASAESADGGSTSDASASDGERAPANRGGGLDAQPEPSEEPTEFCDSYPLPGGVICSACYDTDGNLLSETCAESEPDLRCEELRFREQTCTVCIDGFGNAQYTECNRNDCADGADSSCEEPPACEVRVSGDSAYCRVCPIGSTGESETRCLTGGDLSCRFEEEFEDPATGEGPDDPAATPTLRVCAVCSVPGEGGENEEVYRRCDEDVEAPLCLSYSQSDGECEVCFDTDTQTELYSSCSWSLSPFQLSAGVEGTCSPLVTQTLTDSDGSPVWGPDDVPGEDSPVAVDCTQCTLGTGPASEIFSACRVRSGRCEAATRQGPAPIICTAQVQTYEYQMTDCYRPWGSGLADAGVRQMLVWLSQVHDISAWNGSFLETAVDDLCPNAGRFHLEAALDDAAMLAEIGFVPAP